MKFEQELIPVKVKKLVENAVIPAYAHATDAGMDLVATSCKYDDRYNNYVYGTGLALEIPDGCVGLIFPRSSNCKKDCYMTNHVGVIDSGYRGEVLLTFKNREYLNSVAPYKVGDRIGQLIIIRYPKISFIETDSLTESDRGEGGHGSTGN